jgi:hypothetical protein
MQVGIQACRCLFSRVYMLTIAQSTLESAVFWNIIYLCLHTLPGVSCHYLIINFVVMFYLGICSFWYVQYDIIYLVKDIDDFIYGNFTCETLIVKLWLETLVVNFNWNFIWNFVCTNVTLINYWEILVW